MTSLRKWAESFANIEIWITGGMVVASIVSQRLLLLGIPILAVFWVIRWVAYGRISIKTPLDFPLLVLGVLIPLNYWISPLPEKTLPQLLRLLLGIGLYYSIVNWVMISQEGKKRLEWLVWMISLAITGLAVFSLFSVEWASYKLPFIPEKIYTYTAILVADTVHPNVLAGTLVILLPISFGIVLFASRENSLWKNVVWGLSGGLGSVILVFSQSRGAILALAVVAAVFVVLRWRRGWMVVGFAGILVLGGLSQLGWERVFELLLHNATVGGVNGRLQIWQRAWYMIQDFPITGVGMGLFGDVADALYPFAGVEPGRIPHAHQLFLQVLVDMGIPGFLAWGITFVGVSVAAWQVYRSAYKRNDVWLTGLGAGLIGSQVALSMHGLLDAVTWGMVRPAPIVWGIWGLTLAAWLLGKHEASTKQVSEAVE